MNQFERALEYRKNGLEILPLIPDSKRPLVQWKDKPPLTDFELKNYFNETKNNIGIFCGPKSGNLLVIDFDSLRSWDEYRGSLSHILNRTFATKTRRGYHVFTRTPDPIFHNPYLGINNIDIKFNGYVVAPKSKIGDFQYECLMNDDIYQLESLDELPFPLKPKQELNQQKYYSTLDKPYGLPWHLFNSLKGNRSGYNSRSNAEQALITYCIAQGWTFEQIHILFSTHAVEHTHFRRHRNPIKYLHDSFQNAVTYLKNNPRDIDLKIDSCYQWAISYKWPGRAGEYDRAVFIALLRIAKRTGKLEIGASLREISEMTGMTISAAKRSLERIPFVHHTGRSTSKVYLIDQGTNSTQSFLHDKNVKDCLTLSLCN